MKSKLEIKCPKYKKMGRASIYDCLGCEFIAASLENEDEIINVTCGYPGREGMRIERPENRLRTKTRPRVNKIDRDGVI
jgi:hypothetical protein